MGFGGQKVSASPAIALRIAGAEDAGDDDHSLRARSKDGGEILALDPSDAEYRERNDPPYFPDLGEANRRVIRFRRGGKERAETDVVRPFLPGGESLRDAVSGLANNRIFTCQRAISSSLSGSGLTRR